MFNAVDKSKLTINDACAKVAETLKYGYQNSDVFETAKVITKLNESSTDPSDESKIVKRKCDDEWMSISMRNRRFDKTHVFRCECEGVVAINFVCNKCHKLHCQKCWKILDENHVCNEDDVKTVDYIKSTTKPCPQCGCRINKYAGCSHVTCSACSSSFDYKTGDYWSLVLSNMNRGLLLLSRPDLMNKRFGALLPDSIDNYTSNQIYQTIDGINKDRRISSIKVFNFIIRELLVMCDMIRVHNESHNKMLKRRFKRDIEHYLSREADDDDVYMLELTEDVKECVKHNDLVNRYRNFIIKGYEMLKHIVQQINDTELKFEDERLHCFREIVIDNPNSYEILTLAVNTALSDINSNDDVDALNDDETIETFETLKRCIKSSEILFKIILKTNVIRLMPTNDEIEESKRKGGLSSQLAFLKRVIKDALILKGLPLLEDIVERYNDLVKSGRQDLKNYCETFGVGTIYSPLPINEPMPRFTVWTDNVDVVKYTS